MKKDLDAVSEYAKLPKYIDQLDTDDDEKAQMEKEGDNTL